MRRLLYVLFLTSICDAIQVTRSLVEPVVHFGAMPGTPVVKLSGVDQKKNRSVSFRLHKGVDYQFFDVNEKSGLIVTKLPIQKPIGETYRLIAVAYVEGESNFERFSVLVIPINQFAPEFSQKQYSFFYNASAPEGSVLGTVKASDLDKNPYNSKLSFSLDGSTVPAELASSININDESGEIVVAKKLPEREGGVLKLGVSVSDGGSPKKTTSVDVILKPITAPSKLSAIEIKASSFTLCWVVPESGTIAGYSISLEQGDKTSVRKFTTDDLVLPDDKTNPRLMLDGKRACAKLSDLTAETLDVSVEAWSEEGDDGMPSEEIRVDLNPCSNSQLCNSGTCVKAENVTIGYFCKCDDGYYGEFCDITDPCENSPCLNHASCEDLGMGKFECLCPEGYRGDLCEVEDPCVTIEDVCLNGGTCVSSSGTATCICRPGYDGDACELENPCYHNPCLHDGTCTRDGKSFKCNCKPSYTGVTCDEKNLCWNVTCHNGGTCSTTSGLCTCAHGYIGIHCEFAVNPCDDISPSPCLNGGLCLPDGAGFRCECAKGYHGRSCEDLAKCEEETTESSKGSFTWISVQFGETLSLPCPFGPFEVEDVELSSSAESLTAWSQFQPLRPARMTYSVADTAAANANTERKSLIGRKSNNVVKDRLDFSWQGLDKTHPEETSSKAKVRRERGAVDMAKNVQEHALFKDMEYRSQQVTTGSWKELNRFTKESIMKLDENGRAQAVRSCVLDSKTGNAVWLPVDDSSCNQSPRESKALPIPLETNLTSILSNPSTMSPDQFKGVAKMIAEMVDFAARSPQVAQKLLSHVSDLLEVDDAVMQQAAGSADLVLQSLDRLSKKAVVAPGATFSVKAKNLILETKVIAANKTVIPEFRPKFVNVSARGKAADNAKLVLPDELVTRILDLRGSARLQFMSFTTSKLFRGNKTSQPTSSYVLSASIGNESISNLVDPVRYFVPSTNPEGHYCVFWDEEGKHWSTEGLKTKYEAGRIVCESTHLTSFSILFDPFASMRSKLPEEHRVALSIISYLGSALSMFGLTITVFTYGLFRVLRRDRSGKILLNLSISLLLLNLVFLLHSALDIPLNTEDGSDEAFLFQLRMQSDSADAALCVTLAVLMHYLVLTSFAWMLVEAAHMYHLLITVFAGTETYFILKRAVVAWGLPAIIVSIVAGVDINHYRDPNRESCRLSPSNLGVYYGAFIVPSALIIVTNCVVFLMVVRVILVQGRRQAAATKFGTPEKEMSFNGVTVAQVRGGITVMALVGATWITGPLAVGIVRLPMLYLFCLTNSLQGFVIFLVRVVLFPDARNAWITLFRFGHISKTRRDISHGSYSNSHSQVRNTRSTSTNLLHSTSSNASSIVRMRAGRDEFAGLTRDSPRNSKPDRLPDRLLSFRLLKNERQLRHEPYCPSINSSIRLYQSKGSSFSEKLCICSESEKSPKPETKNGVMPEISGYDTPEILDKSGNQPRLTPEKAVHFEASRTFPRPNSGLVCPEIDKTHTRPCIDRSENVEPAETRVIPNPSQSSETHLRPILDQPETQSGDEGAESSWLYVKPDTSLPRTPENPEPTERICKLGNGWTLAPQIPKTRSILSVTDDSSSPILRDSESQLPRVVEMEPKVKDSKMAGNSNSQKVLGISNFKDLSEFSRSSSCVRLSGQNVVISEAVSPKLPLMISDSYDS